MTSGYIEGGAYIDLHVDDTGLTAEVQASLNRAIAAARASVKLPVESDTAPAERETEKYRERTRRNPVKIPLDPVTADFAKNTQAAIRAVTRGLDARIPLTPEGEEFRRAIAAQVQAVEAAVKVNLPVDVEDAAALRQKVAAAVETIEASIEANIPVDVEPDVEPAAVARTEATLSALTRDRTVRVEADSAGISTFGQLTFSLAKASAGVVALAASVTPLGSGLIGVAAGAAAVTGAIAAAAPAALSFAGTLGGLGLAAATVQAALSGVGDAVSAQVKAQQELAVFGEVSTGTARALKLALADLSPTTRELVDALTALNAPLGEFITTIQDAAFDGLADPLTEAADVAGKILTPQLEAVADSLNNIVVRALEWVATADGMRDLTDLVRGFRENLEAMLPFVEGVAGGLLNLFLGLQDPSQRLAESIGDIGERFETWTEGIVAGGALADTVDRAMDRVEVLGSILGNVGSIVAGFFRPGIDEGDRLLETFDRFTEKAATAVNSLDGQGSLQEFYDTIGNVADVLGDLGDVFGPIFGGLVDAFNILAPSINEMRDALLPVVVLLSETLADALVILAPYLADFIEFVADFIESIPPDTLAQIAAGLIGVFAGFQALSTVAGIVSSVAGAVGVLLSPVALVAGAVALVAGALVVAYQQSDQFRDAVNRVADAITENVAPIISDLVDLFRDDLAPMLQNVADYVRDEVLPALGDMADSIADDLVPVIENLADTFEDDVLPVIDKVVEKFEEWGPTIRTVADDLVQIAGKAVEFQGALSGLVIPIIGEVAALLLDFFVTSLIRTVEVIGAVVGALSRFGEGIFNASEDVRRFAGDLADLAGDAITGVVEGIQGLPDRVRELGGRMRRAGREVIQDLMDGMASAAGLVREIAGNIFDVLRGLINDALSEIDAALTFTILGQTIDPVIPRLAAGGVVDRPTVALIGEAGPEAVIPLYNRGALAAYGGDGGTDSRSLAGEVAAALAPALSERGTTISIGNLMPHNYGEFVRQTTDLARAEALGGVGVVG